MESLEERCLLATFTVTNLLDGPVTMVGDLPGSFRQAIFDANQLPGADDIVFDGITGELKLETGELTISDDLTIEGPGAPHLTIDAVGASRIFHIDDDNATNLAVTIRGLTLTGGMAESGGAILANESLTLEHSLVTGNTATLVGGGIVAVPDLGGTTIIADSVISENAAAGGGGIWAYNSGGVLTIERTSVVGNSGEGIRASTDFGGTTTIADCTIADNSTDFDGGGIFAITGGYGGGYNSTTIERCTISGNHAGFNGGGIYTVTNDVSYDSTIIRDSTISSNRADRGGGVLSRSIGATTLVNTTVSGNSADRDGGGVHFFVGAANNSTIVFNVADADSDGTGRGGGVFGWGPFYSSVENSIVAANELGNGAPDDTAGTVFATHSLVGQDPTLGPLRYNGGPTQTHALLPGSPAIDAGDPNFMLPPSHDQRGAPFQRLANGRIDIGAFESQSQPIDFNDDGVVGCDDVDALVAEIVAGGNAVKFDLTGDGVVDRRDLEVWLVLAGLTNLPSGNPFLPGDANLNGVVDGQDFIIWNENKFTNTPAWCSGDFDADGVVDGLDFIIWNENKFTQSDGIAEFALPRSSNASRMGNTQQHQVFHDTGVEASGIGHPIRALAAQRVDALSTTSGRADHHADDRLTISSFENFDDELRFVVSHSRRLRLGSMQSDL